MRQLILIEGLPGTGKTTLAIWLAERLLSAGQRPTVLLEDDLRIPSNFYELAGIPQASYLRLCGQYPQQATTLRPVMATARYVYLRLDSCPMAIAAMARRWDMGDQRNAELSLQAYIDRALDYLAHWVEEMRTGDGAIIMENGFLQGPINELLFRGATDAQVHACIQAAASLLAPLYPLCLYLRRGSAHEAIAYARRIRGEGWSVRIDAMLAQPGCADHFSRRFSLEQALLPLLPHAVCPVRGDDWGQAKEVMLGKVG